MCSIIRRYGAKQRRLSFQDFVLVACRVSAMYRESSQFTPSSLKKQNPAIFELSQSQMILM